MNRAWENNIRQVDPYVPGEQPQSGDFIKLNTNENPYPPAPKVKAVLDQISYEKMKMYPDYQSRELVHVLAKRYQVNNNQVYVGVGSDDVLSMCFLTYFNSKKPILFPDITYSFYKVWAELYRIPYECPKLDSDFRIRKEDYYKENGGVVIANPNAPTSIYEDLSSIRQIIEHNQDAVVIVDEAYIDFGGESALSLIDQYDNLLVVQTFSKSRAMAGMRVGYAIGNERLISALNQVKYSFNSYTMNMTAIQLGAAAVEEEEYYQETTRKIVATREDAVKKLGALGFVTLPSSTNFLFTRHQTMPAVEIFEALKARKIYVRHFTGERVKDYLRITIGTPEEMEAVYQVLKEILSK